jgi:cytidine deaminase
MSKEIENRLIQSAKDVSIKSYSPYSKFKVGCAILTDGDEIFTGCNIENISFGLTICAERAAVFNAINKTGSELKIMKVVIYTPTESPITPCGACRQVLQEFGNDIDILSVCKTKTTLKYTLKELLPHSPIIKFK